MPLIDSSIDLGRLLSKFFVIPIATATGSTGTAFYFRTEDIAAYSIYRTIADSLQNHTAMQLHDLEFGF